MLQPLSTVDWAERDLTSIGSPGNERLIEAIDQRLAAGDGSAGLTQVLAQMGVKYVVVRNDLIRSSLFGAWPSRIRDALASSPGITEVARFGAPVGNPAPGDAASSFDPPYPPVQIYQVRGAAPAASTVPASRRAAGVRGAGGDSHAGRRGPAEQPPGAAQRRLAQPAGGRVGGHRHAAPPGGQLRRGAHVSTRRR